MSTTPGVIEVHLKTAEQLFNSFDPSPFHERDLDEEAERYIVGWAREIKGTGRLQLIVTLPEAACKTGVARHIPGAIHYYFNTRALQVRQELRELLRIGWRSLAIGLAVLLACFLAVQYMSVAFSQSTTGRLMEQSLIILGWVANWRPLEIFLYDWWPIRRRLMLLRRLAEMPVEVRAASGGLS
ncbi:MAG: hypothetical protein Q8L53_10680 [Aestuariivirga sp.]|nr:hypothetical protein [Aestuariivirga sp.]